MELSESNNGRYARDRDATFPEYPLCRFVAVVVPSIMLVVGESPDLPGAHQ